MKMIETEKEYWDFKVQSLSDLGQSIGRNRSISRVRVRRVRSYCSLRQDSNQEVHMFTVSINPRQQTSNRIRKVLHRLHGRGLDSKRSVDLLNPSCLPAHLVQGWCPSPRTSHVRASMVQWGQRKYKLTCWWCEYVFMSVLTTGKCCYL